MKMLVIDGQIAGAAGDMFLGALLDLYIVEPMDVTKADKMRENLVNELANKIIKAAKLEGKAELAVKIERKNERAVEGIHLNIKIIEPQRHLHAPQAFELIENAIKLLALSKKATQFSKKAFEVLFEAESKAHGESLEKVHLHEAGSLDTFLDVLGTAYLLDKMKLFEAKLTVLPIALGSGTVTFSHGTLPVPVPAVAEIVKKYQIPAKVGTLGGELFTPTGAIIIAALMSTNEYSIQKESPAFIIEKSGVGFGTKQFEKSPNALRLLVGSLVQTDYQREDILVIETNLDDCSGETIGFLSARLLELGAKDGFLTPIYMKKGRPGTKITVLCLPKDELKFASEIMSQTSTIGVRISRNRKIMLSRRIKEFTIKIKGKKWKVRGKIAYGGNGEIVHFKPEFEDVKTITEKTGLTITEVSSLAIEKISKEVRKES